MAQRIPGERRKNPHRIDNGSIIENATQLNVINSEKVAKKKKKKEKEADIITWERARESDPDREPQWSLSYSDEYQA